LPFRESSCTCSGEVVILKQRDVQPLFCISAPGGSGYGYKLRNMQTNAIQRSAQRPVDIKAWLTGKAQSLSRWYNSRSEFYTGQRIFSAKYLQAQEKCLSLPSLKNDESSSRTEHRLLLGINSRAFFMPSLYRIGGCHSVNLLGPVRVKSSFVSSGMCSRFSVSPRPAAPGMETNDVIMQTNVIQRSAQRPVDIKAWLTGKAQSLSKWYNGRSDFFSIISGLNVTRKTAIMVNLTVILVFGAAILAVSHTLISIVITFIAVTFVSRLNKIDKNEHSCEE
jgi:hypothetical protein